MPFLPPTDSATIIDRHDFDGDILELIEEAQKYILKNIHIGMRLNGLYREDVPEISVEAMREAIINAFCHRDYRDPDYVHIAIFKNRVEIRSPGGLYGGLTIAKIRQGNVSKRREPTHCRFTSPYSNGGGLGTRDAAYFEKRADRTVQGGRQDFYCQL